MQHSSSLNLISAYSDSDASDADASPPRPSTQKVAGQPAADIKVAVDHASLASQELQVSRDVASFQPATRFFTASADESAARRAALPRHWQNIQRAAAVAHRLS